MEIGAADFFPEIDEGRQRHFLASFFRPIVTDSEMVDASGGVKKFVLVRISPHPTDKIPDNWKIRDTSQSG